jgi:hypothetical protein
MFSRRISFACRIGRGQAQKTEDENANRKHQEGKEKGEREKEAHVFGAQVLLLSRRDFYKLVEMMAVASHKSPRANDAATKEPTANFQRLFFSLLSSNVFLSLLFIFVIKGWDSSEGMDGLMDLVGWWFCVFRIRCWP